MSKSIMSFNQMAQWKHGVNEIPETQEQLLDDYFECLIDCEDSQSSCRRVCKEILMV